MKLQFFPYRLNTMQSNDDHVKDAKADNSNESSDNNDDAKPPGNQMVAADRHELLVL